MAKGSSKKNADFNKTKLKLGKGKQQPTNATDTSFKARTIALPQQSITIDKTTKLTNSRYLTLTDLAQQLRHYSPSVRKDAILGIRELFQLHPLLIPSSVALIIPDLCRVIGDQDQLVRRNTLSLLQWYLPQVAPSRLAPYLNPLLLFTASAFSHIYPHVRHDAVNFLDLLVQIAPTTTTTGWQDAVLKFTSPSSSTTTSAPAPASSSSAPSLATDQLSHGERFMSCYLNLLGITHRSSSSSTGAASTTATELPPTAKLLILRSLNNFLIAASQSSPNSSNILPADSVQPRLHCPTWFFRSSFRSEPEFEFFERLMRPDLRSSKSRHFALSTSTSDDIVQQPPRSKKRKSRHTEQQHSFTEPHFHSAQYADDSLIDVQQTCGNSWSSSNLHTALHNAASGNRADRLEATIATDLPSHTSASSSSVVPAALHLFSLLHPLILATFLDTAPTAFRPDLELQSLATGSTSASSTQNASLTVPTETIVHLIGLCLTLWRSAIASASSSDPGSSPIRATKGQKSGLANLLGHMATYFPFSQQRSSLSNSPLSQKASSTLVQTDLAVSELTALLALGHGTESALLKTKAKGNNKVNLSVQLDIVSRFVSELLTSSSSTPGGTVSLAGHGALDQDTYASLLPTVWLLLNTSESTLLVALLDHFAKSGSASKVKALAFEFIARLWILETLETSTSLKLQTERDRVDAWIDSLPQVLWEMAMSSEANSSAGKVLEFLRYALVVSRDLRPNDKRMALREEQISSLQDKLVPFFHFRHPTKPIETPGPYTRLATLQDQAEARALVEWLGSGSETSRYRSHLAPASQSKKLAAALEMALLAS